MANLETTDLAAVLRRLDRLDRQNRRLKAGLLAAAAATALAVFREVWAQGGGGGQDLTVNSLTANHIILRGDDRMIFMNGDRPIIVLSKGGTAKAILEVNNDGKGLLSLVGAKWAATFNPDSSRVISRERI